MKGIPLNQIQFSEVSVFRLRVAETVDTDFLILHS